MEGQEIVNYSSHLKWIDGKPVIVGVPMAAKSAKKARELMDAAMDLPYDGDDERMVGLTKGEALIITLVDDASKGDKDARKEVLDRVMGRPVQNVKSLTLRGTLEDFLDQIESPTDHSEDTINVQPSYYAEAEDI